MSVIDSIQISGTIYTLSAQTSGGNNVVELTQAEYDALVDKDPTAFYIITDAKPLDISEYWTSAQTQSAITEAVSGKTDVSAFTAHTADTTIHVTSSEKTAWNGAVSDISTISGDVGTISGQVSTNTSNISTVSASTASNTTALGGMTILKLTQAQYDALDPNYDSNTLYVIVN